MRYISLQSKTENIYTPKTSEETKEKHNENRIEYQFSVIG